MSLMMLSACSSGEGGSSAKPAKAEVLAHETELLTLTLTPETERRLGIRLVSVSNGTVTSSKLLQGEIVAPAAGGALPLSGTTDLTTLATSQIRSEGDLAGTRAELEQAQKAADRAHALMKEEAGSARARDEAQTALVVARANHRAALAQRGVLGPSVSALGRSGPLWVRVAVFSGDIGLIDRSASAQVRGLGGDRSGALSARPVAGPPSANGAAGTSDLYYALASNRTFSIGQRVAVTLPARGASVGLKIPETAILRDIYGGEWVYVSTEPHVFERRRIEIAAIKDREALIARGLAPGTKVVTAGAAELFGTEFGAK